MLSVFWEDFLIIATLCTRVQIQTRERKGGETCNELCANPRFFLTDWGPALLLLILFQISRMCYAMFWVLSVVWEKNVTVVMFSVFCSLADTPEKYVPPRSVRRNELSLWLFVSFFPRLRLFLRIESVRAWIVWIHHTGMQKSWIVIS